MDFEQLSLPSATTAPPRPKQKLRRIAFSIIGISIIGAFITLGVLPRFQQQKKLKADLAEATANPSVIVAKPQRGQATTDLILPGQVEAIQETAINARTSGYLRQRYADIGDRVKNGQLLAQIESPETDKQVDQAIADLATSQASLAQAQSNLLKGKADVRQAQANLALAQKTWQRWQVLQQQGAVPKQDADEKQAAFYASQDTVSAAQAAVVTNSGAVKAAIAGTNSSQANLQRYRVLQSYETVKAPFDGIVTVRNVDAGALITAGGTTDTSLFSIAKIDTLRIHINVPQTFMNTIKIGQTASLEVRELPNQKFTGIVKRTANALDAKSNTLLTEIQISNPNQVLRPGMYAQVKFTVTQPSPPLLVPSNTVVIRSQGAQVAIMTNNNKVHYQSVKLGKDYGTNIEIMSGLQGNEQLITNVNDSIQEGATVQLATTPKS